MYISAKIKEIRKSKNMTQQQFAKELNISRYSLINYEKGYRKPSLKLLLKICDKYNIDISEFNEKRNEPKPSVNVNKDNTMFFKTSDIREKSNTSNAASKSLPLKTFTYYLTITGYPVKFMNDEQIKELYQKTNDYIDFEFFKRGYIKIPGR